MPPTEDTNTAHRVGADGDTVEQPREATDNVVEAQVPGDDPANFVTLTLAHPLNEKDRVYLGLPADASTEVGQKVRVNKNGAKQIINAGYATVDPEDSTAVRSVLRGESAESGEPTSEPDAEAFASPAVNPPNAPSTPVEGEVEQPVAAEAQGSPDAAPAQGSTPAKGAKGARGGSGNGGSGTSQ